MWNDVCRYRGEMGLSSDFEVALIAQNLQRYALMKAFYDHFSAWPILRGSELIGISEK